MDDALPDLDYRTALTGRVGQAVAAVVNEALTDLPHPARQQLAQAVESGAGELRLLIGTDPYTVLTLLAWRDGARPPLLLHTIMIEPRDGPEPEEDHDDDAVDP